MTGHVFNPVLTEPEESPELLDPETLPRTLVMRADVRKAEKEYFKKLTG